MFGRMASRWVVGTGVLVLAAASSPMRCPGDVAAPADMYGRDNAAGVYVRDSAVALEKLALAQRMQRLKEWGKSADLYQEILEKYPDRVVPAAEDAQQRIVQYTSVTEAVRQALCQWPPEGLEVYRGRYEAPAAKLLAQATSGSIALAKLHQVFSLYFPTESGKSAGIALMDAYFELGDYAAVSQIGQRLLRWHPDLTAQRPMVLYRAALAEKLCGDDESAQQELQELLARFPRATGTIRGQDVLLTESLQRELARATAIVAGGAGDSWTTAGGDESRGKISTSTLKPAARLYSIPLSVMAWRQLDPNLRRQLEQQNAAQEELGARLGVMPAVDHSELFFQDNVCLYAVDLDSGTPLATWTGTWPGGVYRLSGGAVPVPAGQQLCVTVTDQYVAAVMGLPDRLGLFTGGGVPSPSRLVCLDRRSGQELWTVTARHLPEDQAALRHLQLESAPLIVGDNLYVIGLGGKGQQFEDCYVLCFNVTNGQFRWATYIASSASEQAAINADGQVVFSDAVSHIAYAGGRLFVVTNLGAVASLDAYSGSVLWLNIYREQNVAGMTMLLPPFAVIAQQQPQGMPLTAPPWIYNPAIVQNGRVFVFPVDSKYIYVYDAGTGREIKRIWPTDLGDYTEAGRPDTLLAVHGDMMYLSGPVRAWSLPWRDYDHDKNPAPPGSWASFDVPEPRGRGFVTGDAIYLPRQSALRRLLLKNGSIDPTDGTFPKTGWDKPAEGPGNVVVAEDHLIVAGDHQVAVYADIDMARAKLDRQVAAAPDDPEPRLHYAEVMFVAGQTALAEQKLQEAFARLGGVANPPGPVRQRAFADAMDFAARLGARSAGAAEIAALYDLAHAAAQTPMQQAQYCQAVAGFHLSRKDFAGAIQFYQQILSDPAIRAAPLLDPQTSLMTQAGAVAEKAIAQILISPEGQDAYARFEQAAADALARAQAGGDPLQLLDVARLYPNAQAAHSAMMVAARQFEARGDARQATLVLRKLLNKDPQQDRDVVLEAMARNYAKLPGRLDVAVSRLALAAAAAPAANLHQPLVLPDGSLLQGMTLAQAHDLLARYSANASNESLPDFRLPTSAQRTAYAQRTHQQLADPFMTGATLPGMEALLPPLDGFARNDRLVAWNAQAGLLIFAAPGGTPLCSCAQIKTVPRGIAWLAQGLAAWTADGVFLIDPQTGQLRWSVDLAAMGLVDALNDSALGGFSTGNEAVLSSPPGAPRQPGQAMETGPAEQIVQVAPISDRLILASSRGRLAAVDLSGKLLWQHRVSERGVDRLLANEDFAVVRFEDAQNIQLVVLNSDNGEWVGRKSFSADGNQFPVNLALAADGTLVYTLPDRICIQDLYDANSTPQGMEPKLSSPPALETAQMFLGAAAPDQLIVHGGRVFAVADQGRQVRIYSLDTAKPWEYSAPDGEAQTEAVLPTRSNGSPNVTLRISGDYLYVLSSQDLVAYQIDRPWLTWNTPVPATGTRDFAQMLLGRDYLILVDLRRPPLTVSNRAGSRVTLCGYSRARLKDRPEVESGNGPYPHEVAEPGGIVAWQAFEGGIAYFSQGSIHILLGMRDHINEITPN